MSIIYSIYRCTNTTNGKVYIGFTKDLSKRIQGHKSNCKKENIKFYNAIIKYGWNNFIWETIYQSKDKVHTLNTMEPFFIKEYDSTNIGYNICNGGNMGPIYSGEKNGMFGKTHSIEARQKMSTAAKMSKGKSYEQRYGKEKSIELKKLRSIIFSKKNNSGKNNSRYDNTIYNFYNIKDGNIITCDRYTFYNYYKINKGGVSEIINKGITYNNWCILFI